MSIFFAVGISNALVHIGEVADLPQGFLGCKKPRSLFPLRLDQVFRYSVLEVSPVVESGGPFLSHARRFSSERISTASHRIRWFFMSLKIKVCGSRTCKPNSVRNRMLRDGHSSGPRITAGLKRPTRRLWRAEPARTQLAPDSLPIWSCSVWGLPCPPHYCGGGALLPHLFTLT